jgi:hypothetical protein
LFTPASLGALIIAFSFLYTLINHPLLKAVIHLR